MSPKADAIETGRQLREMREAAGMKQLEVAAQLAVSLGSLGNWENGRVSVTNLNVRRLRKLYRRKQAENMKSLQEVAR